MKRLSYSRSVIIIALATSLTTSGLLPQTTNGQPPREGTTTDESSPSSLAKCLPADVKLNDIVEASISVNANSQRKVTVEQKLNELKANCTRDNKLIDGSGRQIVFYHLIGCWGNPPADYRELLEKQREEINKLKHEYTVIEMTCNPSGTPIS